MVRRLLATREDVFEDYRLDAFRAAFESRFDLVEDAEIAGTERRIFRFVRRP